MTWKGRDDLGWLIDAFACFSVIAAGFDGGITMLGSFVMLLQGKSAAEGRELDLGLTVSNWPFPTFSASCCRTAWLVQQCAGLVQDGAVLRGEHVGAEQPSDRTGSCRSRRPIDRLFP